ncbi:30S ribosomal protein S1 [Clostridium omnivorum]|uniref:30S ribosomal protein S1 n=1 Tax=Clostridium omnivorum TaxID=1604902 RepID=A0ABQ5N2R7_9CLOT|nr:30S ribosomal protein S1 [Clostridium sp. E14]GLC29504.1 30S ribosomal protein S1 [Clostridium sp. E14]
MDNFQDSSMKEMMEAIEGSLKRINSGDIVKGTVISVSDSEVFVNIGYMADGIIDRAELSDDPAVNPKDIINAGDELYVYIINVNDGEGNVELSKKRADAVKVWDELSELQSEGKSVTVKVKEAVKGGAVAYIKGIRAFIPASQLAAGFVEDINSFVGKDLEVKIIELDKDKNKVILSGKEVAKEAKEAKKQELWNSIKKGEKRTGTVTRLARFGAFVDLGGVDGLIHNQDLSWKRIVDPAEIVSVGDKVEVYVLDFDKEKGRISLGLKEISEDPWNTITEKYSVGSTVEGTVVRLLDFGAFVEIAPGIEGLVHISEISEERIAKPASVLKVGDKVKVKVLSIDTKEHKMSLSIKEAVEKPQEDYSQFNDEESSMATLADLFKDKLKNFKFEE